MVDISNYGVNKSLDLLDRYYNAINKETDPEAKKAMFEDLNKAFGAIRSKFGHEGGIWDFYNKKYQTILDDMYSNPTVQDNIDDLNKLFTNYKESTDPSEKEELLKRIESDYDKYRNFYLMNEDTTSAFKLDNTYKTIMKEIEKSNGKGSK